MSSINDIQGVNCRFQILVGDDYLDVICAKTFRISTTTEMKETTTTGSGFWKEFRPKKLSYILTMSGMFQVVEEQNRPVIADMMRSQKGFLPVDFRLLYIDNSDNPLVLRGRVYVENLDITADPINLLDSSVQMLGTGELFDEYEIPVYIDMTVQVTGTAEGKFKFILIDENGEPAYNTDSLDETQANGGWLILGQSVTFNVLSGSYYYAIVSEDVNSDDNDFDLNTPSPGPAHLDFDHNPISASSYPSTLHDFTADRSATFTTGAELPPPVCIDVSIIGMPALPDGEVGIAYSYSFNLDGTAPFGLTINNRPAWLNIVINDSTVQFSGTPDVDGTNIAVDITITNCSSGSVNFSDTIDIAEASEVQSIIDWSFTEDNANGTMTIHKNGVQVVSASDADSGVFNALPDDEIAIVVGSGSVNTRSLLVNATVGGDIYDNSGVANQTFTFTVTNGVHYSITGGVSNS